MKKLLFLTFLTQISFAQDSTDLTKLKKTEKIKHQDNITVEDVKRTILEGEAYEEETTTTRTLSNAVEFFPDNIVLPIAPDNPNVININQVTLSNMNEKLKNLIENANKSFKDNFQLKNNKLTIESTATSVKATATVPDGYTKEQVKASYTNIDNPTNNELVENRANNLKTVLLKFIPELDKMVKDGSVKLEIKTLLNQKTRLVKVSGLEFSKNSKVVKVKNEYGCGDGAGVNNNEGRGDKTKNWLYLDNKSSGGYTRAIRVDRNLKGDPTKTVTVNYDPLYQPERFEIYTRDKDGTIKEELKGESYISELYEADPNTEKYPTVFNSWSERYKKSGLTLDDQDRTFLTSDCFSKLKKQKKDDNNIEKQCDMGYITLWKKLLEKEGESNFALRRYKQKPFLINNIDTNNITHVYVNAYSPLKGTQFILKVECK